MFVGKGSSSEVLGRRNIVGLSNGQPSEEERLAIGESGNFTKFTKFINFS